jgi:hypothetical protein
VILSTEAFVVRPYLQAAAFLVISLLALLIVRPREVNGAYTISGVIYALFIVVNCVMLFYVPKVWPYFLMSMLFSVLYIVAVALLIELYVRLFSASGDGESGMVFLVIMYHPLAALLAIFCRWAYQQIF